MWRYLIRINRTCRACKRKYGVPPSVLKHLDKEAILALKKAWKFFTGICAECAEGGQSAELRDVQRILDVARQLQGKGGKQPVSVLCTLYFNLASDDGSKTLAYLELVPEGLFLNKPRRSDVSSLASQPVWWSKWQDAMVRHVMEWHEIDKSRYRDWELKAEEKRKASDFSKSRAYYLLKAHQGHANESQLRMLLCEYIRSSLPRITYQLDDTMDCVEVYLKDGTIVDREFLPLIQEGLDWADDAMCESLNEASAAIRLLVQESPLSIDDVLLSIEHIWNALACNYRDAEVFADDETLCELCEEHLVANNVA